MTDTPTWLASLQSAIAEATVSKLTRVPLPDADAKPAAVLMIFAGSEKFTDASVLLVQRQQDLRKHAGHVAFPGGAVDPSDADVIDAALRETWEEASLVVERSSVLGTLPELFVPVSHFAVTPVVAWLPAASAVSVGTETEIASVRWVGLDELLNPKNRVTTRLSSGYTGPAFDLPDMFVWGFTAGLLSRFIDLAGLTQPWDPTREVQIPTANNWGIRS